MDELGSIDDELPCEIPFNFSDQLFTHDNDLNRTDDFIQTIDHKFKNDYDVTNEIKQLMNRGQFHIVHLNINSVFNKFEHILSILDNTNVDIIALNEIKLDDNVSFKLLDAEPREVVV